MTEYSRMAKGNYVVSGGTLGVSAPSVKVINLPFKPDYVELINYTQAITPATHGIPFAFWDASVVPVTISSVQYDTIVDIFSGATAMTTDSVKVGGGISVFSAGLSQQFGPTFTITGITAANPAVVTTSAAHGYSVGDTVIMQGIALATTNNMQLLNGVPFTISAVTSTTFTIKWDASGSQYVNSGFTAASLVRKVLYPFLYLPEDNFISAITLGNTTTITTTMYHNFLTGQEVAFRIPTLWGTTQLNSLPNVIIPGSPIYGYVVSVTDNWTFVVNINSSAYTAFTNNFLMTAATLSGLTYAQVLSVGDVNTGGEPIGIIDNSTLYPPPIFPTSTNRVGTINGPAIRGAFVNNTSQGFIIGASASRTDTSSWVGGSNGDRMEWRAYLHDFSSP